MSNFDQTSRNWLANDHYLRNAVKPEESKVPKEQIKNVGFVLVDDKSRDLFEKIRTNSQYLENLIKQVKEMAHQYIDTVGGMVPEKGAKWTHPGTKVNYNVHYAYEGGDLSDKTTTVIVDWIRPRKT